MGKFCEICKGMVDDNHQHADSQDIVSQKFGIVIFEEMNKKTGQSNIRFEAKDDGMGLQKAIFYVESWLERMKEKQEKLKKNIKDMIKID